MSEAFTKKAAAVMAAAMIALCAGMLTASAAPQATTRPRPGSDGSSSTRSVSSTTNRTTTSGTSAVEDTDAGSDADYDSSVAVSDDDEDTPAVRTDESADEDTDSTGDDEDDGGSRTSSSKTRATVAPAENLAVTGTVVETAAPQQSPEKKKGVSKTAMFIWFLLSVVVNGIISFVIGNRFYKLSRKESHVTSEIRALRRDVEEKFAGNVGGFAESEFDADNSNEDYSMDEEGIKMTPVSHSQPKSEEADEMFRKWEAERAQRRAALKKTVETAPEFDDEDDEDDDVKVYKRRGKKTYRPKRDERENDGGDEDIYSEEDDGDEDRKGSGFNVIRGKTKEFLNDIFPFKED